MAFNKKCAGPERPFCSCVVAAAGASERMGEDKLQMRLGSSTVLMKALEALQESPYIDEIVLVIRSELIPGTARLAGELGITKLLRLTEGGETRTLSVLQGVRLCSERAALIAVHDGARPLVTADVIERAVLCAAEYGAAAPAVRVKDTVRQARRGKVLRTLDRDELWLMQTPQVFRAALIRDALEDAARMGLSLTDDCQAVMLQNAEVRLVEGAPENIKLTTPEDIFTARAILEGRGEWTCG